MLPTDSITSSYYSKRRTKIKYSFLQRFLPVRHYWLKSYLIGWWVLDYINISPFNRLGHPCNRFYNYPATLPRDQGAVQTSFGKTYLEGRGSYHCICFMLHPLSFLHKIIGTARPRRGRCRMSVLWRGRSGNVPSFCSNLNHN